MRVLVTGAGGMLGRAVTAEYADRKAEVISLRRSELDITDLAGTRHAVEACNPDVVVNCAAYTNVDCAEAEPRLAYLCNGLGARNLALACREAGADLMHISTDYVFNGSKRAYSIYDPSGPINVYGGSKLWGEKALAAIAGPYYLVRTSWLFGSGGNNFVDTMLRLGSKEGKLRVVNDQRGNPTYTVDLARAIADLSESGCYGIYHVTNQDAATWYEFAREIFKAGGLGVNLSPCSSAEFPRPARRPKSSVLDPFPLRETVGYLLPLWQDALARYLSGGLNQ